MSTGPPWPCGWKIVRAAWSRSSASAAAGAKPHAEGVEALEVVEHARERLLRLELRAGERGLSRPSAARQEEAPLRRPLAR